MAIQFSRVTLYNNNDDSYDSFLVCGIPTDCSDLENFTHYDNFIKYLDEDTDIDVEVDTYLYGEGEIVVATIEEVAYMHLRLQADEHFLENHTHYVQSSEFTLHYSPGELFGIDWG